MTIKQTEKIKGDGRTPADYCAYAGCDGEHDFGCVARVPLFCQLTPAQLLKVSSLIKQKSYGSGSLIFTADQQLQDLLIVRQGRVKIVRYNEEGNERLLDILHCGDFYGGEQLFQDRPAGENGIAATDCTICYLNTNELAELIVREPEIGLKIIQYYSGLAARYRIMQEIIVTKDALKRLAMFLSERYRIGERAISLSQEEIAQSINLTQETVNRKIAELKRIGALRTDGQRKIRILDIDKLRGIAGEGYLQLSDQSQS